MEDINAGRKRASAGADKALRISITGDAAPLAAATKQAVGHLNEVKSAAEALMSGFTGGLVGGGVVAIVQAVTDKIGATIRETKRLIEDADSLATNQASIFQVRNLSEASGGLDITGAIQSARLAKAEALAGDPNYTAAFKQIGVSLSEISNLDPVTTFYRLVAAMKEFDPAAKQAKENFAALSLILGGRGIASELTAFAKGGPMGSLFDELRLYGRSGEVLAAVFAQDPSLRAMYKGDFEPPGAFGVGDQIKADRISEENAQREAARKRALLSLEEQLKAVAQERASLEEKIAQTTDVVRRARLSGDIIGLDAEADRVRAQIAVRDAGVKVPALRNVMPDVDQFARMGLFVGGGRGVSLQEQQVALARELIRAVNRMHTDQNNAWQ